MSSPHRIQVYLEQYKIGPLFEDLMAKLISEMPTDPVPFLIRILQKNIYQMPQTVMSVPQLRRSLGNLTSALEVEKLPIQRKPSSAIVRKNSRPVTPSVVPVPKKSVTICFPMRGGKHSNVDRSATLIKSSKAVPNKSIKISDYSSTVDSGTGIENKTMLDFKSNDESVPRWRSGGYSGPVIPGAVFMEDPFKDEAIDIKRYSEGLTYMCSDREHSQKTLESLFSCSKESAVSTGVEKSGYKIQQNLNQEDSCDFTEDNFDREMNHYLAPVETEEYPTSPANDDHFNFTICSVCSKVMNFRESLTKSLSHQPLQTSNKSQNDKHGNFNIPLLQIPKDTSNYKEDLFASIRSLPLPKSPVCLNLHPEGRSWYESTLESIYSSANGWKM